MNLELIKKHKNLFCVFTLFLFIYFLFFHNLWAYELLDLDETRYVNMSQVMHQTKDFLTLYLNGQFFFEKPPLYFWLENISFYIFHSINEFSARVPGVVETITTSLLLFYVINKATKNFKLALMSSLILCTSAEYLALTKISILDILLATTVTISVLFGYLTYFCEEKNKKYFWWCFYLFSGLAVLAKGIPGFVVPFACMFFIGIYTKKLKEYFKLQYFLVGFLIFFIVVLPWHLIMFKMHNPLFYNEYIIKHHIARFLGGDIIHRDEPWWFYLVTILWGCMPYTHTLITLIVEKIKNIRNIKWLSYADTDNKARIINFAIISAVVTLLFFSSSKTKLVTYILPIYPFLSIILANYWLEYIEKSEHKKSIEISSIILNSILILAGLIFPIVVMFLKEPIKGDLNSILFCSVFGVIIFPVFGIIAIKKEKRFALFLSYIALIVYLSGFCFHKFMKMDYRFGQNDLLQFAKIINENNYNIYTYETGLKYSLNYYAKRNVTYDVEENELDNILSNKSNIVITRKKYLQDIKTDYKILKDGRKFILLNR